MKSEVPGMQEGKSKYYKRCRIIMEIVISVGAKLLKRL